MPAKSEAQRRLMAAALHGADFPKARQVRESMSDKQLREFAAKVKAHGSSEAYTYNWRSRANLKRGTHG